MKARSMDGDWLSGLAPTASEKIQTAMEMAEA